MLRRLNCRITGHTSHGHHTAADSVNTTDFNPQIERLSCVMR